MDMAVPQKLQTLTRAVRVSEPPLRSADESNYHMSYMQTPVLPLTQCVQKVVSVFQPYNISFQQPFIGSNNTSQLNMTVNSQPNQQKSRTVNSFHSGQNDHQQEQPQRVDFYVPLQRLMGQQTSPLLEKGLRSTVNQNFPSHNVSLSNSKRIKTEEHQPL